MRDTVYLLKWLHLIAISIFCWISLMIYSVSFPLHLNHTGLTCSIHHVSHSRCTVAYCCQHIFANLYFSDRMVLKSPFSKPPLHLIFYRPNSHVSFFQIAAGNSILCILPASKSILESQTSCFLLSSAINIWMLGRNLCTSKESLVKKTTLRVFQIYSFVRCGTRWELKRMMMIQRHVRCMWYTDRVIIVVALRRVNPWTCFIQIITPETNVVKYYKEWLDDSFMDTFILKQQKNLHTPKIYYLSFS